MLDQNEGNESSKSEMEVTVWRGFKGQESEMTKEKINVREFKTATAKVGYWSAGKVNIGNYESVDVGVSITVPCYLEEVEDAYAFAEGFVSKRLSKEIGELREQVRAGEESKSKRGR